MKRSTFNASVTATRRLADQRPAASFEAVPETRQWICTCGGPNAANRDTCRTCGASRDTSQSAEGSDR